MCTVSWLHSDDGYHLLSNRDEKRTRLEAFAPEIKIRDGVRYIAPTDGEAGGTWIAVNEFGVGICLLNSAGVKPSRTPPQRSRGLLIPELIGSASAEEVAERGAAFDLGAFAPLTLAILEPGRHTSVIEWDGHEKAVWLYAEPCMPLVSSSFDAEGVKPRRRDEFRRHVAAAGKLDPSVLVQFHGSHGAGADAYSPCMHRGDAGTVSFSWIQVTRKSAKFFYTPAAPCQWAPGQTRTLPLRP